MRLASALAVLTLTLAACDGTDVGTKPIVTPVSKTAYTVEYAVEGTYSTCDVGYVDADRSARTAAGVTLPWTKTVRVAVGSDEPAFGATLTITCSDPERAGKADAVLRVGGQLRRISAIAGRGASTVVTANLAGPTPR